MNIEYNKKYIENVIMRFDLYRIYRVYIYIYIQSSHSPIVSLYTKIK